MTHAFAQNPSSDGIGGVRTRESRGGLREVPTPLKRRLNAGNEMELLQYPALGDKIYQQSRFSEFKERIGKDGTRFLIVTTETTYTNQDDAVFCILRASSIIRRASQ